MPTVVITAALVFSAWLTTKVKAVGNKILGPVPQYKGFKLPMLSAPVPPSQSKINLPFLVAMVGLLFGAGYLLRGVATLTR